MKQLSVSQKKWLKSVHLVAAGIWLTTGLIMFLVQFMSHNIKSGDQLYLINKVIHFMDMKVLVPSAILCLFTGWVYSQFTKWGYFKHGWLIFKWTITLLIITLGTVYSEPWIAKLVSISAEQGISALSNETYQWYDKSQNIMGVSMTGTLIITVFISVFKPKKAS